MIVGSVSCVDCVFVYNHNGETVGYVSNGTQWKIEGSGTINGKECYQLFDDKWIPKKFITFKGGLVNEESNRYV